MFGAVCGNGSVVPSRWVLVLLCATAALALSTASATDAAVETCEPTIVVGSASSSIQGTECDDLIIAPAGVESVDSGAGDDLVIGTAGARVEGGAGEDLIYGNGAHVVSGGAGDDVIEDRAAPERGTAGFERFAAALSTFEAALGQKTVSRALSRGLAAANVSSGGGIVAASVIEGDDGDNILFGGSGNDTIRGHGGADRIFGNIGDDFLYGGDGNDLIAGGHGADDIYGQNDADMIRGDGTIDRIYGGAGTDTLSFASGVTPGFTRNVPGPNGPPNGYTGFPGSAGERGVYLDLTNGIADNGKAQDGGGVDDGALMSGIENLIGSPFADYIVGDGGANVIDGGGGTDVILGMGGNDTIYGNAGGDNIDGGTGTNSIDGGPGGDYCANGTLTSCNEALTSSSAVLPRNTGAVAVGMMTRPGVNHKDFYLVGSTGVDNVELVYATNGSAADTVTFKLTSGSFDTSSSEMTSNCDYSNAAGSPKVVVCSSNDRISTILIAGMDGNDDLFGPGTGMPRDTTFMALGGNGNDWVKGTDTSDDLLVDGPGDDTMLGYSYDDGLINNSGADQIWLGDGDDLALTVTLCDGDQITGGNGVDNASWAKMPDSYGGVAARLTTGLFGYKSSSGPTCAGHGGSLGTLNQIENLEGSSMADTLVGDGGDNHLLGRSGSDFLYGGNGKDRITANDGETDQVIDCGNNTGDWARADPLPKDPGSIISGCKTVDRS